MARKPGCDHLGTEHLLYAIAFAPGSRARRVLTRVDLNLAELKKELACFVDGPRKRRGRRWDEGEMCFFCGKRRADNVRLVAGPAVRICEECVRPCTEILFEESRK
jgi:hypothetical protein